MPYRHPSVLANIAATVDVISGGRLIIGLGAGWNQDESDALGIRLPPLKERMDQFEEGVQVIVELLSARTAGELLRTPLHVDRRVVRAEADPAAASADRDRWQRRATHAARRRSASPSTGTRRSPTSLSGSHKCEVLERHCADVGRDPTEIERSVNVRLAAGQDPRQLQPTIERWRDAGADVVHRRSRYPSRPRSVQPLAAALAEIG